MRCPFLMGSIESLRTFVSPDTDIKVKCKAGMWTVTFSITGQPLSMDLVYDSWVMSHFLVFESGNSKQGLWSYQWWLLFSHGVGWRGGAWGYGWVGSERPHAFFRTSRLLWWHCAVSRRRLEIISLGRAKQQGRWPLHWGVPKQRLQGLKH